MKRGWITLLLALLAITLLVYGCADKFVTSGKISMNQKNWDKAIGDFNKALEVNPNNAQAHFYLGKAYGMKQNYPLMAQHLDKADSLDPKLNKEIAKIRDSTWFAIAGSADTSMNEVPVMEKNASSQFESALALVGAGKADSATPVFDQARATLRIRDNADADKLYSQAVETAKAGQPAPATAAFDSAMTLAARGIYQGAKDKFETAIMIDPQKPQAYAKAGFAWFRLGNDDSSFSYYKKAHDLAPDNVEILGNLARMAYALNKSDMVDSLFAQLLQRDPSNAEGWVIRGNIAKDAGRIDDAVEYYKKALDLNPKQCNIWFNLGVIYFQKMQKIDSTDQAYAQTADNAEQAFIQASNLCPDDVNTLINLNVVLITNKKLPEAISRLKAFTDKFPKECAGWDLLSQALLKNGQGKDAAAAYLKYQDCQKGQ